MRNGSNVQNLVFQGLMAALIFVATCLSFPNGVGGYTHLGDAMIIVAVMFIGSRRGAVAAGIGAMLADLILGYGMWAPFSLIAKVVMVIIIGLCLNNHVFGLRGRARWFAAVLIGCIAETAIYAGAGYILEGGIGAALAEAGGMVVQCGLGMIVGFALSEALQKSPLKQKMAYRTTDRETEADSKYKAA